MQEISRESKQVVNVLRELCSCRNGQDDDDDERKHRELLLLFIEGPLRGEIPIQFESVERNVQIMSTTRAQSKFNSIVFDFNAPIDGHSIATLIVIR